MIRMISQSLVDVLKNFTNLTTGIRSIDFEMHFQFITDFKFGGNSFKFYRLRHLLPTSNYFINHYFSEPFVSVKAAMPGRESLPDALLSDRFPTPCANP